MYEQKRKREIVLKYIQNQLCKGEEGECKHDAKIDRENILMDYATILKIMRLRSRTQPKRKEIKRKKKVHTPEKATSFMF